MVAVIVELGVIADELLRVKAKRLPQIGPPDGDGLHSDKFLLNTFRSTPVSPALLGCQ